MNSASKHILVVDNDPHVLDSVSLNLEMADYTVVTASSRAVARAKLQSEIIHLAIVDVRLESESSPDDLSGFEFAREIPSHIPCLIFTAYEDKETIRTALGKVKAYAILNKADSDAAIRLIEIVDEAFASAVQTNFDLRIEGPVDLAQLARDIRINSDIPVTPSNADTEQIVRTLFRDAMSVQLTPLVPTEPAQTFTQMGSALVCARPYFKGGRGTPVAAKFCEKDEAVTEAHNYKIIKPRLGGTHLAILDDHSVARSIGGLRYSLIGAQEWEQVRTFAQVFLSNEPTATLKQWLERFFSQTFGELYADSIPATLNLTDEYTRGLHLTPSKLKTAVNQFNSQVWNAACLAFDGLDGQWINPLQWALPNGEFRLLQAEARQCLCHGDLHSRNILVDPEGHFWLIDFARVADTHVLRDFAELETDIKFNLLSEADLHVLLSFEQALLAPARFRDDTPTLTFESEHLDRTYQIVAHLRHIASTLIPGVGDMREYYQALLLHTLNILRLRHISDRKKLHALLSAALICQKLEQAIL